MHPLYYNGRSPTENPYKEMKKFQKIIQVVADKNDCSAHPLHVLALQFVTI